MSNAPSDFRFPPIESLMRRFEIRPRKRFSQNFLRRYDRCEQIADIAQMTPRHVAVEIGAGLGNLTTALALRAGKVVCFEPDTAFDEWYEELMAALPNVEFVRDWFAPELLEEKLSPLVVSGMIPVVVANLPYKETSGILLALMQSPFEFESIVVMVQREVADRIAAGAGTRACGLLTCYLALRYEATIAMRLPPGEFQPSPDVHSAVLVLKPLAKPLYRDANQRERLFRLMKGLFTYRRKTLLNCLTESIAGLSREDAGDAMRRARIDPQLRPEALQLDAFMALEEALGERLP